MSPAATKEFDPFKGTSGLEPFDGSIIGARFGYDSKYNDGQSLVLLLDIKNIEDGEEQTRFYSVGRGWEEADGGKSAARENGKDPEGFNDQTAYHAFIQGAFKSGAEDVLRGRGLMPWEAELWTGLNFTFGPESYQDQDGKDRTRFVPTDFLGEAEAKGAKASKAAPTKKAPAKAAPAKEAADEAEETGKEGLALLTKPQQIKLTKLAGTASDYDDFVQQAYVDVDGIADGGADVDAFMADESEDGAYLTFVELAG